MRVTRVDHVLIQRIDGIEYYKKVQVYGLPDGKETHNEDYADIEWGMYRKHCVECPYKVPERSTQFRKA